MSGGLSMPTGMTCSQQSSPSAPCGKERDALCICATQLQAECSCGNPTTCPG